MKFYKSDVEFADEPTMDYSDILNSNELLNYLPSLRDITEQDGFIQLSFVVNLQRVTVKLIDSN